MTTTKTSVSLSSRPSSPRRGAIVLAGVVAAVLAVGAVAGVTVASRARVAPPAGATIAVLDLEATFDKLEQRKDLEANLKNQRDAAQAKLQELQNQIDAAKAEFEATPSGPQKLAKGRALRDIVIKGEFEAQFSQKRIDELRGELRRELYNRITDAVGRLGKQSGWGMVINSDAKAEIPMADADTVARAISIKRTIYVDASLDVTEDVVNFMNNEYRAGGTRP
jgi:Skp family chaperone for outer membrane proteins